MIYGAFRRSRTKKFLVAQPWWATFFFFFFANRLSFSNSNPANFSFGTICESLSQQNFSKYFIHKSFILAKVSDAFIYTLQVYTFFLLFFIFIFFAFSSLHPFFFLKITIKPLSFSESLKF